MNERERLSALMDGDLGNGQARRLLSHLLARDGELRNNWDCYHLIGDTLRGAQGTDACARLCARIDAEPAVLVSRRRRAAAKLARFTAEAGTGIAAVVFVVAVVWIIVPDAPKTAPQTPAPEAEQAAVPAGDGARDYLFAHQPYSPSNALQGLAVYARTIAQEVPLHSAPVIRR